MSKPIRVLIANNFRLVRAGLHLVLERQPTIEVVGEAAVDEEAIAQVAACAPDVVLLDLDLPRKGGIALIAALKHHHPAVRVLILTSCADDDLALTAIRAGAAGYLLKTVAVPDLIQAIHMVDHGEMPLDAGIARQLLHTLTRPDPPPARREPLTRREQEILHLVARGLFNQDIAAVLCLTEKTVRTHMNHILRKLQMTSRTQAALYALKNGLANLETN
jgi:DNA-binding NarL/FixJ family response regulator